MPSHERASILQQYLLLHSQHDSLQGQLHDITSFEPSTSSHVSQSPARAQHNSCSTRFGSEDYHRSATSPPPLKSPPQQHGSNSNVQSVRFTRRPSPQAANDQNHLRHTEAKINMIIHVNEQIRFTLMKLLSCEGVSVDDRYRRWVQIRITDAETELLRCQSLIQKNRVGGDPI